MCEGLNSGRAIGGPKFKPHQDQQTLFSQGDPIILRVAANTRGDGVIADMGVGYKPAWPNQVRWRMEMGQAEAGCLFTAASELNGLTHIRTAYGKDRSRCWPSGPSARVGVAE